MNEALRNQPEPRSQDNYRDRHRSLLKWAGRLAVPTTVAAVTAFSPQIASADHSHDGDTLNKVPESTVYINPGISEQKTLVLPIGQDECDAIRTAAEDQYPSMSTTYASTPCNVVETVTSGEDTASPDGMLPYTPPGWHWDWITDIECADIPAIGCNIWKLEQDVRALDNRKEKLVEIKKQQCPSWGIGMAVSTTQCNNFGNNSPTVEAVGVWNVSAITSIGPLNASHYSDIHLEFNPMNDTITHR